MVGKTSQIRAEVDGKSGQMKTFAGYGMTPREVLEDRSLSVAARLVYGWLALERFGGNTVSKGNRLIAERMGLHRETVARSVIELELAGHIAINGVGKQRRVYILLHEIFSAVAAEAPAKRAPLLCAKCGKAGKVNKACHCKACAKGGKKVNPEVFARIDLQIERQMKRIVSQSRAKVAS